MFQRDFDFRMVLGKAPHQPADGFVVGLAADADAQLAGQAALDVVGFVEQFAVDVEGAFGLGENALAAAGQAHAARRAVKQGEAEIILHRLDMGTDCGLAQEEPFGCARNAALARHRGEGFQVMDFHEGRVH